MTKSIPPICTDKMMRDLRIIFPKLWMRPLREFGGHYAYSEGIWTGSGHCETMPDGEPIFSTMACSGERYDGDVHDGFIAWLERRGWAYERYDGATFFLVPETHFHGPAGPEKREYFEAWDRSLNHKPSDPDELPF